MSSSDTGERESQSEPERKKLKKADDGGGGEGGGGSGERESQSESERKKADDSGGGSGDTTTATSEHGSVVAAHYNTLEEKGREERYNSPIFYMRNFNNWVKSVLINLFTEKLKERDYGRALRVLDVCCGKGGDLIKWQMSRIKHLVCADIAAVSVQQCRARYDELSSRGPRPFTAEFIAADCTKERLREKYADPSLHFDLVSCQFGFHYCFESLPQAECMLRNVSECLRPGGYFIGTIPDAYEIVARCRKSPSNSFGNKIFNIKLLFNPEEGFPLFGAKYDFHLEGVVDCPEFLVNFRALEKLAAKFGLELVLKEKFDKFFESNRSRFSYLLSRIKCFESYPPARGVALLAPEADYAHAERYLKARDDQNTDSVGTMSQSEWEAATIYMAFAFKKCKSTLDANGKPVYETDPNYKKEMAGS